MRENIAKLYHAIRFQRWLGKTESIEYFSKAKHDKIEPQDFIAADATNESNVVVASADANYVSWLKEHPSALTAFPGMMSSAKGKQIVVFLDYDGTLAPIVDDPERAFMSDAMRLAVREVSRHFPTAVISGRSRSKVYEFIKLDEVYYAGSHGMDIMGPFMQLESSYECKYQKKGLDKKGNVVTIFQPAREFLPEIQEILNELKEVTIGIPGVFIEDNRFCISVHYRHVQEGDYPTLEKKVLFVLGQHSGFHLTRGKKVLELRPSIKWNKGNALVYLLDTLGFAESGKVLPIYIGDDKTDEDAFKVLKSRGIGFPIIVSSTPRDTLASVSLRDPSEVLSFLIRLARWGETST